MLRLSKIILATVCLFMFSISLSCDSGSSSSKITILPKRSYDYGSVGFGQTVSNDFTFSNKTTVSISITSIQITGTNANQFAITAGGSATNVPSNGTHTITVEFSPLGGSAYAVLRVNYNDENNSPKEISVDLRGKSIDKPVFTIDVTGTPPTYGFGAIASGNTKTHPFRITNNGNADLKIDQVTLNNSVYTIVAGFTPGNTEVIHKGDYHEIYVRFAPQTVGPANAIMSISHNAENVNSPYEVNLTGAGGSKTFETNVTGTPSTIDFGSVFSGVARTRETITITNNGFDDLEITNISLSSTSFSIVSGWSGTTIKVGSSPASYDIVIEFDPQAATSYNETITFTHNGANVTSPTDIHLTGVGTTNYNVEQFTIGYIPLASGTYVQLTKNEFKSVSIGFDFNFYGNTYDTLYISSKGYVGFGPTTNYDAPATSYPLPSSSAPNNVIMLFSCDMDPVLGATFRYRVEGAAPNRAFVLHIVGLEDVNQTGIVSGQIRLFETLNTIELCYPTKGITWPNSTAYDVLIGLENLNGTKAINYNGVDPNPVTATPTWNYRYK